MALSMLTAILVAPALLGTQESIRQSQAKEKREEHRARRCNLIASCVKSSLRSREIDGRPIVLRNGKLYIDSGTSNGDLFGHQYAGYYLPYPDATYEGLVTTITDIAPIMNWVYIDKASFEVRYGVRVDAQPNLTGPFNCTRQDRRLTFNGWEGWCAVEEFPSIWALYFDHDDDGLRSKVPMGTRVLEVELMRKEKRWQKESVARNEDQKVQRAVNAEGQTPIENLSQTPNTMQVTNTGPVVVQRGESNTVNTEDRTKPSGNSEQSSTAVEKIPRPHIRPEAVLEHEKLSTIPILQGLIKAADEVPLHDVEELEGATSSPTDPQGGSDWSVHGDDFASTRSLSGYTPASSIFGEELVEELPVPHGHALDAHPPPIPPIPEEYRAGLGTYDKEAKLPSTSHSGSGRNNYQRAYVEDDTCGGD